MTDTQCKELVAALSAAIIESARLVAATNAKAAEQIATALQAHAHASAQYIEISMRAAVEKAGEQIATAIDRASNKANSNTLHRAIATADRAEAETCAKTILEILDADATSDDIGIRLTRESSRALRRAAQLLHQM